MPYLKPFSQPSTLPAHLKALRLALACAGALIIGGCGGAAEGDATAGGTSTKAAAVTSSVTVKKSLEDNACALTSKETLGALFDIPAADINQTEVGSMCSYSWKDGERHFKASIHIKQIGDDARSVASGFESSTRSMTGAEVDNAFKRIAEQAEKDKSTLDTPEKQQAADMIIGSGKTAGARGIQFEDVDGIADQARFQVGSGDLNVRHGNIYFSVDAFAGDTSPTPTEYTAAGMMQASKDWMAATMPQRREHAIKLAQAIVKQL